MAEAARFRLGRLDHVHVYVPDLAEAASWYSTHLGFEPVERFGFWAHGVQGGPLQMSADGGHTSLALFEASERQPMVAQENGIAFSVDADTFIAFARSLPNGLERTEGGPLTTADLVDFDLCWAFDFVDPWGNRFELNCYDHDRVRSELVVTGSVVPDRKWPADLYERYVGTSNQRDPNHAG